MRKQNSNTSRIIDELKRSRERLELAQKAAKIGVYEWDIEKNKLWFSEQETILFGNPGKQITKSSDWISAMHPEDQSRVSKEIQVAISKKKRYIGEFRVIHPDGNVVWLKSIGRVIYKGGKAVRMVGINYDITNRRLNEELLKFKAEASRAIASSLNYKKTLNQVAEIAIEHIADWCTVEMLDENNQIELFAIAHKDPDKIKWAREYRAKNPIDMEAPTGVAQVIRTGKPVFYPNITPEMLQSAAKSKKELALIKKIGFTSVIIVPIIVDRKPIGVITLISAETKWHYDKNVLEMSQQLATRAALAIENSKLYEAVRIERLRLNRLVANVPGVVWEAWGKPDEVIQRIDFVSEYVEQMLGYTIEEWLATPNFWLSIVHPEDQERAARESVEIFTSNLPGVSRFRWIAKDGRELWVESHSQVVLDKNETPVGMRGVTMDISDRMEIERRKDEFISMASHELKTPITSLKVFTQILQKRLVKKGESEEATQLGKMDAQIDKLTHLVTDLLDVSKIQSGKLELRKERFALADLIYEIVESIQLTTDEHNIEVKDIPDEAIYADRDRIGQVLINLLTNAIKYSPDNKKIIISCMVKEHDILINVQDFGIGIEKEHRQKVFDRFYRVFDTRDKTFPGLGIGLYISNQIVTRHKGRMWVKSKSGSGSTFTFSLPRVAVAE